MGIAPGVDLTPDQITVRLCDRLGYHDLIGEQLRRRAEADDVKAEIAEAEAAGDEDRAKLLGKEADRLKAAGDEHQGDDEPGSSSSTKSTSSTSSTSGRSAK